MERRRYIVVFAFAVVAALSLGFGCRKASQPDCLCADNAAAQPPVDASLMAYLSRARAIHHQADIKEREGDLQAASALLENLVSATLPGKPPMSEAKEVQADARARLSDLKTRASDFDGAEREVAAGLAIAPSNSYLEGHLYEQRGVNEESRSKSLLERGDQQAAAQAKDRAMKAFEKAVVIQDSVIENSLRDGGPNK
jgi:hypothetical protein